jgi:S1-C subfamily serine protease
MNSDIINSVIRLSVSCVSVNPYAPYINGHSYPSVGTGFFISEDLILTCGHVVEDAIKILFTVPSKEKVKYKAGVVSVYFDKDIALLKSIDYKSETWLELGDSNDIKLSDSVTAVGYPLGSDNIKSAEGSVSGRQNNLIQHHVPINSGNSGGPLFNEHNKVMGINSAKIVSDDVEGISYTIPINDIIALMDELKNPTFNDKVIYAPKLLIRIQDTDDKLKNFFGYNGENGILISKLFDMSPLYNIGVRESDILLEINNYSIDGVGELNVPWAVNKISIFDLLSTFTVDQIVPIKFYSVRSNEILTDNIQFNKNQRFNIRNIYYPYQNYDYEVIGGMVFMDLNHSHIDKLNKGQDISVFNKLEIINYDKLENINKRRLLLASVVDGSNIETTYELSSGVFVENVNRFNINNLDDFRKHFKKGYIKDGVMYVYIKFSDGKQIILNTKEVYDEDIELSKIFRYDISSLLK